MFTYIDSINDLNFLNRELLQKPYLGIDTEFRRTSKEEIRLALLQINDGEEIYLVDAVAISDPEESCNFLNSKEVIKIVHSCKEDLEAIYAWTGQEMFNIFDTQLANAFLGGLYSIGYQGLVEEKLEILLDKKETRSNWLKRPLTDSQLNYAASDVQYLINLYCLQEKQLIETSKIDWHREEIDFLISIIFERNILNEEVERILTKEEENKINSKFNQVIEQVAAKEKINPTLLFSKKNQKDFIRLVLKQGTEEAFQTTTKWRKSLLKDSLDSLLRDN